MNPNEKLAASAAVCVVAFATSVGVTGVIRAFAIRVGRLDELDPARRMHTEPTPRLGGVGMVAGLLGAEAISAYEPACRRETVLAILLAAFVVGLWDDLRPRRGGLRALVKLALQVGIGAAAVWVGMRVNGAAVAPWGQFALGAWTIPLTIAWIVAVMNVVNFMDGSDAIAATTCVVILGAAGAAQPLAAGANLLPLAAATLGFLLWNAPRARIFMGDGGSHLLGAAIALAACDSEVRPVQFIEGDLFIPAAPWPLVGAALLPSILDVGEALIHKARHGIPMSQAHHDHLYQRLVKATGSHGLVALRYGVLALLAVVVVGPFAQRFGALAAGALGLVILAAHWIDGVRRTRNVPRLGAR